MMSHDPSAFSYRWLRIHRQKKACMSHNSENFSILLLHLETFTVVIIPLDLMSLLSSCFSFFFTFQAGCWNLHVIFACWPIKYETPGFSCVWPKWLWPRENNGPFTRQLVTWSFSKQTQVPSGSEDLRRLPAFTGVPEGSCTVPHLKLWKFMY